MKPIGIFANVEKIQVPQVTRALLRQLKTLRKPFLLERELAKTIKYPDGLSMAEIARKCQLLIVLGGDGTVLRAAREIYPHEIPMLCVNLGTLGFLAALTPNHLKKILPTVINGKSKTAVHSTLNVEIHNGRKVKKGLVALNDVVISRGAVSRVVELGIRVDGEFLNSYFCDGIIISTATGSTAYSLSAGGPIVVPHAQVHTITPICPHTLSNRSVIIGERSVIETQTISQPEELFLSLDGQSMIRLNPNERVRISAGRYKVRMICVPEGSFFELLRKKLRWAGSHV